jgi:LysR family glycine cleavage system transcriptional activator
MWRDRAFVTNLESIKLLAPKIDLRKLPPLNALKGFEAATRRESVREAAEELCLTHPAVSYQIQVLERDLGIELFSREGRSLAPTAEGRLQYKYVRNALEILIEGAETLRRTHANAPLRVQTYVTASIRWLARRLQEIRRGRESCAQRTARKFREYQLPGQQTG